MPPRLACLLVGPKDVLDRLQLGEAHRPFYVVVARLATPSGDAVLQLLPDRRESHVAAGADDAADARLDQPINAVEAERREGRGLVRHESLVSVAGPSTQA
jgi:hypothetical protein